MIKNGMNFKVTHDLKNKKRVLDGIKRNKEKYGKAYCPCVVVKEEETVCHCEKFRLYGDCCCGLFVINEPLEHKGFEGVLQYSKEMNNFYGYITNSSDYLTFSGNTIEEAKEDFKEIINNMFC